MPIFKVAAREGTAADPAPKPRLLKAEKRSNVESFLLSELFIEKASAEEAHALAKQGVEVQIVPI